MEKEDIFILSAFLIFLVVVSGCISRNEPEYKVKDNLEVRNLKAVIILIPENFRDEEFRIPREKLEMAGVSVTVAGLKMDEARGMLGMTVMPDTTIDNISVDDYDAIILPGGSGSPEYLWNNEDVHKILREANEKNKVIGAICLSGAVLANSGILKGKEATVFPTEEAIKALEDGGAIYKKESVVVDGNIVTADGPQSADRFADEILRLLESK